MPSPFNGRLEQAIKRVSKIEAEIKRVERRMAKDQQIKGQLQTLLKEAKSYYSRLIREFRDRE